MSEHEQSKLLREACFAASNYKLNEWTEEKLCAGHTLCLHHLTTSWESGRSISGVPRSDLEKALDSIRVELAARRADKKHTELTAAANEESKKATERHKESMALDRKTFWMATAAVVVALGAWIFPRSSQSPTPPVPAAFPSTASNSPSIAPTQAVAAARTNLLPRGSRQNNTTNVSRAPKSP